MKNTTLHAEHDRELLILLIKEDLKIHSIRRGLELAGFYHDHFYTDLPDLVFKLLKIADDDIDRLMDVYCEWIYQVDVVHLNDNGGLRVLAEKLYGVLERLKLTSSQQYKLLN